MNDLSKMSLDDLIGLEKQIGVEIESRRNAEKVKAQKEIMDLATRYGMVVSFAGASTGGSKAAKAPKAKGTVAVKYRHPQDSNLTWTGRGRSPVWVAEWKAKHGSLDGIAV